jgi:hypothetical protein
LFCSPTTPDDPRRPRRPRLGRSSGEIFALHPQAGIRRNRDRGRPGGRWAVGLLICRLTQAPAQVGLTAVDGGISDIGSDRQTGSVPSVATVSSSGGVVPETREPGVTVSHSLLAIRIIAWHWRAAGWGCKLAQCTVYSIRTCRPRNLVVAVLSDDTDWIADRHGVGAMVESGDVRTRKGSSHFSAEAM